jgi:hypothetical protein
MAKSGSFSIAIAFTGPSERFVLDMFKKGLLRPRVVDGVALGDIAVESESCVPACDLATTAMLMMLEQMSHLPCINKVTTARNHLIRS